MLKGMIKPPHLPDLSDQDLLDRAAAGDQDAFAVLVHRYQRELYCFAKKHVGSEEAQDVIQLTLLQLYISLPQLQRTPARRHRSASIRAWLYRVTWNRCIDVSRKHKRESALQETLAEDDGEVLVLLADSSPLPEEQVEQREGQREMQAAIGTLPPTFRCVMWLRYTEELSFKAISERLHMPLSTTKTYYYRGSMQLRRKLGKRPEASSG